MDKMRFGDAGTADVLLTLMPLASDEAVGPLKLHSKVLSQAQFFKAQLSERWASNSHTKPAEIHLGNCKDPVMYVKFLELLYMPEQGRHFSSIEEALGILEVAAQLLCEECISCCMNYVEALAWTSEQEEAIRACISSLNLMPSPDLALKLSSSTFEDFADEVEHTLHKFILLADQNSDAKQAFDVLFKNLQDLPFAVVIENLLLQDLHEQIKKLKNDFSLRRSVMPKLTWLLDHLQRLNLAGAAIKIFAEDIELAKLFNDCFVYKKRPDFVNYMDDLFGLLSNGKVVLPKAVRMALVTSWFPVFVKDPLTDHWLEYVVKSLPMADQHKIFNVWVDYGPLGWECLIQVFPSWCNKLKEASKRDARSI